jgi:integrase
MAHNISAGDLKNRTNRLKLAVRIKPYFVLLGGGTSIGYGRNKGAGAWVLRASDGKGGYQLKRFAQADDLVEANGVNVLTYRQALEKVSAERGVEEHATVLKGAVTVGEALDEYELDLGNRGGLVAQVARARNLLKKTKLLERPVALLTYHELRGWRDSELKRLSAGSVTRTCKTIKAALTFVAKQPDNNIKSNLAWVNGLASVPDSNVRRRGMLLSDERVREIVDACRAYNERLGLFVEVLAVSGCRASQVTRLLVEDLKSNGVMMPRSMKGKGKKRMERAGFPLPEKLLERLRVVAEGREMDEPLLQRIDGGAWTSGALRHPWRSALEAAGLPMVIPYALRYTSITRAVKKGVEPAIVAASRDTSVRIIQHVYSADIDQVSAPEILESLIDIG